MLFEWEESIIILPGQNSIQLKLSCRRMSGGLYKSHGLKSKCP